MERKLKYVFGLVVTFMLVGSLLFTKTAEAAATNIVFPVIGPASYSNDYNAPRASGPHHAIDIIASKHRQLVSVVDGTIVHVACGNDSCSRPPSWGYSITIQSNSGYRYRYIHMNNDNPGTDDGRGTAKYAYAVGMKQGDRVRRGQLIGWVGDSGNAENTVSHVHFEKFKPNGQVTNPYEALNAASRISTPHQAPRQPDEVLPHAQLKLGVNVDMGNFAGDDNSEFVTGAHAGATPRVRVYNRLNSQMDTWYAYASAFEGGVDVTAGDIDGDGTDEVITGPGKGGGPRVRIFEPNGTHIRDIWAYGSSVNGGVRVAAADIDSDGDDEVITGAGPGSTPRVRVFDVEDDVTVVGDFLALREGFRGGIDVAGGDVTSGNNAEIITGTSAGGGPYVKIFSLDGTSLGTFTPYSTSFMGGVRVSVGDVSGFGGKSEILTVPMARYVPLVKVYDGNRQRIDSNYFWEEWWQGYYDVGGGNDAAKASTGVNRRSSARDALR